MRGRMLVSNMTDEGHGHIGPEDLEAYSLGHTAEEHSAQIEEHLLTCERCRRSLEETDAYALAMKSATADMRRQTKKPRWKLIPTFAAAACVMLAAAIGLRWQSQSEPAFPVSLTATRANLARKSVPAHRVLELHPDLTGLPESPAFRMEMVDQSGKQVWQGEMAAPRNVVVVPGQSRGTYFVRVYGKGGDLLREYGLEIGS